MDNKMDKKYMFSEKSDRIIFDTEFGSVTQELSRSGDGRRTGQNIHSAPIDIQTMSKSFSNEFITDWEWIDDEYMQEILK